MSFNNFGWVAGAVFSGIFSVRGASKGLRWGILALALLAVMTLPLLLGEGTAQAQQAAPLDYDTDDDGLIEVDSLARLNAMRWDLNGDGKVAAGDQSNYDAAFPNAAAGMGCGLVGDHDADASSPDQAHCIGYELTTSLSFDRNGDNAIDSSDAYWNSGAGWEPVGLVSPSGSSTLGFAATFDGNGNTIDYLFINRPAEEHGAFRDGWIGLFRHIDDTGEVRNLSLTNVNVSGGKLTGALAGGIYGTVSGVSASGEVSGKTQTGGIAGFAGCEKCAVPHITNSAFEGAVTGDWNTGGLIGESWGKVADSNSAADVAGIYAVGGLVGTQVLGSIVSSHASGKVISGKYSGGLAGVLSHSSISNSYATGYVVSERHPGGLVGWNQLDSVIERSYATGDVAGPWAGGLVGWNHASIKHSYATGDVDGTVRSGGGLVGTNGYGSIVASYATGPVTARWAGGLVGNNYALIQDSYSSGQVTGEEYVGGFIAWNRETTMVRAQVLRSYSTGEVGLVRTPLDDNRLSGFIAMNSTDVRVTDSYWDTTSSRQTASVGGTGYTTAQLQTPTGYTGIYAVWDVDLSLVTGDDADTGKANLWDFGTASQYPKLKADLDGDGIATAAEFGDQYVNQAVVEFGDQYVNQAPVFLGGHAVLRQVMENTPAGTDIGNPVAATDPEGDTLTYSLGTADDDNHFAIDAASGQLQTNGALDYESDATYVVTVTATDPGGLSSSIAVTINVTDMNEEPSYPGLSIVLRVAENSATGTDIGAPITANDPDGDALIYSLGTTPDDNHFAIDAASGQLQTRGALDYESDASYIVTVTATDPDGLSASVTVTINVTDVVNEGGSPAARSADAADGDPRLIRWTVAPAADADTYYRLRRRPDVDGSRTRVIVKEIRDGGERDADERPGHLAYRDRDDALVPGQGYVYGVRTFYGDGSKSRWHRVGPEPPADVNEAPAYADASIALRVAENTAAETNLGDPVAATDPDGDALTYALGGADASHFAMDAASGQLSTEGALDYESDDFYTVTVTATDPDGLSARVAVTITVTDVKEAPSYADASIALRVAENTTAGTNLGDPVAATDPDGDTLTYTLGGADAAHFAMDAASGQLSAKGALDYEADDSYTVTVTATDPDGLSASATVSIAVTDVADTPPGQPAPPTFTNIAETSFRILWTAPTPGSSPRDAVGLQYKLTTSSDDAWADVKPAPGTGRRGFNLKNRGGQRVTAGMSYDVRVRERNAAGWGQWSEAGTVTTAGTAHVQPAQPAAPTFTEVQERRFRILWQAPTPGASPITGYDIEYKLSTASDAAWADVKPAPRGVRVAGFNLTNRRGQSIAPGTSYDVRVRAQNDAGWGEWSETGTVTTAGAPREGS